MPLPLRPFLAGLLLAVSAASPLAAQTTHTVTVRDFEFDPAELTINTGDTVVWENEQGFHNVNGTQATFPGNPVSFGNAVAGAPWTYSFTFGTAGNYSYQCDAHPIMMQGAVTVLVPSSTEGDLPPGVSLSDPAPNPFRDETAFTLTTATPEPVRIAVYDALGREVAVLHDGPLPAGTPTAFVWAPAQVRGGVYVIRVEGDAFRKALKVVLAR